MCPRVVSYKNKPVVRENSLQGTRRTNSSQRELNLLLLSFVRMCELHSTAHVQLEKLKFL